MAKYMFVVMTNATAGHDAEFNAWYDNQHIPDVLRIEGFKSAQRFQLPPEEAANPKAVNRYLTLYEVEAEDLGKTQAAIAAAAGSAAMPLSPTLDTANVFSVYYKAAGEKVFAG